jgi:hypothetical protein
MRQILVAIRLLASLSNLQTTLSGAAGLAAKSGWPAV